MTGDGYSIPTDFPSMNDHQREDWAMGWRGDDFTEVTREERRWRHQLIDGQLPTEPSPPSDDDEPNAPPVCPREGQHGHVLATCPKCLRRARWAREQSDGWFVDRDALGLVDETLYGDQLFDLPPMKVLFGVGEQIVSAEGQPWGIFGPDGTGKTTIGQHYSKGRLGLPRWGSLWGMPIVSLPEDRTVLYLALDRTHQIREGMRRGLDRDQDSARMHRLVMKSSTLYGLATERGLAWMISVVEENRVGLVVIDSRKDIGSTLDADSIQGVNNVIRTLSNDGIEVLVLGHTREGISPNFRPSIEHASGHREVVSGLGSVIILRGTPGAPTTEVWHVKPIHDLLPSFVVANDHTTGIATVLGSVGKATQFEITDGSGSISGTVPVNGLQRKTLEIIDANNGSVPSIALKTALGTTNLARDMEALLAAKIVKKNNLRGPQARWERGANAPIE